MELTIISAKNRYAMFGARSKKDGTFVVTLTKDWNMKLGNKDAVSYWEYQVDSKNGIKLLKSEDNDKLIAIIK